MRARTSAGVLAFAIAVRLLSLPSVDLLGARRLAGGPDAFYHLRRAEIAAEGALPARDLWTDFPWGQEIHWPPLYDLLLGGVLRAAGPAALVLLPVLLGAAAVLLLAPWARGLLGGGASYALLAYALLPAAAYPTVLGALDHHGFEAFLFVAALAGAARGDMTGLSVAAAAVALSAASVPAWPVSAAAALLALLLRFAPAGGAGAALAAAAAAAGALALPLAGRAYLGDPWMHDIGEAQPLVASGRDLLRAVVALSPGFLLIPLALALWWRRRAEPAASAALAAAAVALPLALLGARFTIYLAVPAALALAESAAWAARRHGRRVAILLAAVALLPPVRGLAEIPTWPADPSPALAAALDAIRTGTPPAGDDRDPLATPAWGVAAAWDLGHHVLALGRRPATANPFHVGRAGRIAAHRVLFSPPAGGTAAADALRVRCLLLTNLVATGYAGAYRLPGGPPPIESLFGRLYYRGEAGLGWSALHVSDETLDFEGRRVPVVQVWVRIESDVPERGGG